VLVAPAGQLAGTVGLTQTSFAGPRLGPISNDGGRDELPVPANEGQSGPEENGRVQVGAQVGDEVSSTTNSPVRSPHAPRMSSPNRLGHLGVDTTYPYFPLDFDSASLNLSALSRATSGFVLRTTKCPILRRACGSLLP
jgi:hypothetical protein